MATEPWPAYDEVTERAPAPRAVEAVPGLSHAYRAAVILLDRAGGHNHDIADLAIAIGRRLGLSSRQLRRLEFGALLHDVGKIHLPQEILDTAGCLTAEERGLMERHPVAGQVMLENAGGLLEDVGPIVRCTHERYDGRGYPDGLAGQAIPVESRVISCCDAFDAMTTQRPYREALPVPEALARLSKHRGTQFDPDVVDALVEVVAPHPF